MAKIPVRTEITGKVWRLAAEPGQALEEDDPVVILESMKMEIPVAAPADGKLVEIKVAVDDMVQEGDVIAVLET